MNSLNPADISLGMLEDAYRNGIFPMGDDEGISFYTCEPRMVIDLANFHVPRRLAKTLRSGRFEFTINRDFGAVIRNCANAHREQGVWITPAMVRLFEAFHRAGRACSVEAWRDGQLAGGLYGVAIGGAFMGESMFHLQRDASKACLVFLARRLLKRGFVLLDTQFTTPHYEQFGLLYLRHEEYLERLDAALELDCTFI